MEGKRKRLADIYEKLGVTTYAASLASAVFVKEVSVLSVVGGIIGVGLALLFFKLSIDLEEEE